MFGSESAINMDENWIKSGTIDIINEVENDPRRAGGLINTIDLLKTAMLSENLK